MASRVSARYAGGGQPPLTYPALKGVKAVSDYIQDYLAKELVLHAKAKLCMQVLARNMVAWMARQWAAWALNKIMLWTPAPVTLVGDEHGLLRAVQAVYVYVFDVKTKQIEIRPAAQKDSDV